MPSKDPEVLEGIVKDYFCSNYSEIDFGIRWMKRLTLKCGILKILLTILFH